MSIFINRTKRTASELLADLSACRQFRHISADYRQRIIDECYLVLAKCWMRQKAIKHPDPNNLCTNCGKPRSKYSGGQGLCFRCYASEGVTTRELWVEDVFLKAVEMRGFSCDACAKVHDAKEAEQRNAVGRMLDGIEGQVRLVLCAPCSSDFKTFCSRVYGRGAWRKFPDRDVEKMAIAWLAQKVKVLAERVMREAA